MQDLRSRGRGSTTQEGCSCFVIYSGAILEPKLSVPYVISAKRLTGGKDENGLKTLHQNLHGCVEVANRLMTN